jgi:hypothetical protein
MKPDGVKPLEKFGRWIIRFTWILVAIGFARVLWDETIGTPWEEVDFIYLGVYLVFLCVTGAAISLVQRFLLGKWVQATRSLEILLGEDVIIRRTAGHPDITLRREEVDQVHELAAGGIILRGGNRHQQIVILPGIDGYDEVRSQILAWGKPRSAGQRRLFFVLFFVAVLAPTLAHLIPHWVNSSLAYGVSAASFLFLFVEFQRSPNVDTQLRRLSWVLLVLAVLLAMRSVLLFTR